MKLFLFAVLSLCASTSFAYSAIGTLNTVHFMSSGVVLVYSSGPRQGAAPSCVVGAATRFALDGTTPGGKVQLAGILAAYTAGKTVNIQGAGNCAAYGDTESISYFFTVDE